MSEVLLLQEQRELLAKRLEKLKTQASIAKQAKQLTDALESTPTLHYITAQEQEEIARLKGRLVTAMRLHLPETILVDRDDVILGDEIEVFVANYVEDHWLDVFSHLSTTSDHLPRRIIFRAIHDYLDEFEAIREDRGYALAIRRTLRPPRAPWAVRWIPRLLVRVIWLLRRQGVLRGRRRVATRRLPIRATRWLRRVTRSLRFRDLERPFLNTRSAGEYRHIKRQEWIQRNVSFIQSVATAVTAGFMILMIAYGVGHLVLAGWYGLGDIEHSYEKVMKLSLHALEVFLVAPLPYLLMIGLNRYIKALAFREDVAEYKSEIMDFKGFEIALFIAIVAAVVIERFLGLKDGQQITYEFAISAGLIIAVLTAYFWIVERHSHHESRKHARAKVRRAKHEAQERRRSAART